MKTLTNSLGAKTLMLCSMCTALAACSEDAPPIMPPVAPPTPPMRMADPLPPAITPSAAANMLGSGFAVAFSNGPNDPLVDDPEINDIAPIAFDALPLDITDPS